MTLKDRLRRARPTSNLANSTSPTSSQSTSPITTQPSSRTGSTTSLSGAQPLALTQTMSTLKASPTTDSSADLKLTKTGSSLKSLSKRFASLRRDKKEKFGRRYDPVEAARLGAWSWNEGARKPSVWSVVSPNTSRRGSAISGYAVKQEIEIVEVERRLGQLVV